MALTFRSEVPIQALCSTSWGSRRAMPFLIAPAPLLSPQTPPVCLQGLLPPQAFYSSAIRRWSERGRKGRTNSFSSGFHFHNSIRKHARGSFLILFTKRRFSSTLVPVSGFQYFPLFFFLQKYPARAVNSQCLYSKFSPKIFGQYFLFMRAET